MSIELPSARSLAELVVRSLASIGGQGHRHDIIERALEIGNFTPAQLAEPTHAVGKRGSYPTELHYRLSWAITHAHNSGDIERVAPSIWRLTRQVVP